MRMKRNQVIERLKAGELLFDDGVQANFKDGGHCNVFTFWWMRDRELLVLYHYTETTKIWKWNGKEGERRKL